MDCGTLVLCTSVLYAPHAVLCGLALLWQPMLMVMSLVASFVAFVPFVVTGVVFQTLRWADIGVVTHAVWVVAIHFVLQNIARVGALHVCLRLQRLGLRHGLLLVRSCFPLVPLSIAVGAGFAASSLLVSGGALLSEAWGVGSRLSDNGRASATSTVARQEIGIFASSGNCARLPLIVQSCFQQTFFSCGQVAWTVMMGQAYAALYPQNAAEDLLGHTVRANDADDAAAISVETSTEAEEDGSAPAARALRAKEETVRQDAAELLLADGDFVPVLRDNKRETAVHIARRGHASTGAQPMPREEAAVNQPVPCNTVDSESCGAGTLTDTAPSVAPFISEATRAPTVAQRRGMPASASPVAAAARWRVAGSVLEQQLPTAALTGAAALVLHLVFVLLPLTEVVADSASAQNMSIPFSGRGSSRCLVSIPLQCAVTLVSVVWGLWIVELERHPSAYTLLQSPPRS
ncbi:hypothetical protein GH5_08298 [Leishmania sp. Ghana 2012 LV757]|uniref:hypothetical protein n=1 Tax=Leishmania sp. Ghana 2012 LV757 TaxID=2803181 RepID=UPI001B506234|nr:hypothetical protein GH5_08298 [Leishmania sp. Ghana 2012 LV757]